MLLRVTLHHSEEGRQVSGPASWLVTATGPWPPVSFSEMRHLQGTVTALCGQPALVRHVR